jgi:hypothetical protein
VSSHDERARRIGLNESIFRSLNEDLEKLADRTGHGSRLTLICECGRAECTDRIEMPRERYERLRADPLAFAVVPGHEQLEFEDVIGREDGLTVVRKRGEAAAEVARETDLRG